MNRDEIMELTNRVYDETIEIYMRLHEMPELGNEEFMTTQVIVSHLTKCGFFVENPLQTGAVGLLNVGSSETIALRADIDALPIRESTGVSYSSKKDGLMHACGHDVHTAALLGAAKALSLVKEKLPCNVKVIFQPDEEGNGGAKRLVNLGVMEGVDKIYGMHIRTELADGSVAVKYGKSYAASDMFFINIKGISCHGAEPSKGVSALMCAVKVCSEIDQLSKSYDYENNPVIVSLGTIESGSAINIIPGQASLSGIIRTLGKESRNQVKERLRELCNKISLNENCEILLEIRESYPGVVNLDNEVRRVKQVGEVLTGVENVIEISMPTMTTEDFGYYLDVVPGAFYHIGAGSDYPLHSDKMLPGPKALKMAIAMNIGLICI